MEDDKTAPTYNRSGERTQRDEALDRTQTFPTEAVVGIIEDPHELIGLIEDLREIGFDANVLCGEVGIERIRTAGGPTRQVRLVRTVQELFGFEADHARRHMKALDQGQFVVLVASDDSVDEIADLFANHGGCFVNYYSRWTSRTLIP